MKVGILTYHWSDNFGAVLQCMALQRTLELLGHTVQVVDYRPFAPPTIWDVALGKTSLAVARKCETLYRSRLFEQFRRQHLTLTAGPMLSSEAIAGLTDGFDALIAGSDQVWNPRWLEEQPGMEDAYFLRFARPGCRRIAYAASFGHATIETIPTDWRERFSEWLGAFDAIGVREASGSAIVRNLAGRNDAERVADPTLLLEREVYSRLAGPRQRKPGYLFSFMLHGLDRDAVAVSAAAAGVLGLAVHRCNARSTGLHRGYVLPSPVHWLRLIRDASLVVTNSFHCLVFCMLFRRPFLAILIEGPVGSMNNRITELLADCGLSGRILAPGGDIPGNLLTDPVDWSVFESFLGHCRRHSLEFLFSALGAEPRS